MAYLGVAGPDAGNYAIPQCSDAPYQATRDLYIEECKLSDG